MKTGKIDYRNETRNGNWGVTFVDEKGRISSADALLAVAMDIRDQLIKLNNLLHCRNFIAIPSKLDAIHRRQCRRKHIGGKTK